MMYWSYSTSKMFRRCQRQWFYHDRYANAVTKDPQRNYAFALKKLTTVSQWRGMIVDQVLSKQLVPSLAQSSTLTLPDLKRLSLDCFDRQFACARRHPITDRSFRPRDEPDFAAFHCLEYGPGLDEDEVARARADVLLAMENLFKLTELRTLLKTAQHRTVQHVLRQPFGGMNARGIPDLVLYYRDGPPVIIDWKVHALGELDAWQQLGIYALLAAAQRTGTVPEEIRLLEVQLLLGEIREHRLEAEDVERLRDYIADSVETMLLAVDGQQLDEFKPQDFPRAQHAETCAHCSFVRLCWPAHTQPKLPPWP